MQPVGASLTTASARDTVIMLTGFGESARDMEENGVSADYVVSKPIGLAVLRKVMARAIACEPMDR